MATPAAGVVQAADEPDGTAQLVKKLKYLAGMHLSMAQLKEVEEKERNTMLGERLHSLFELVAPQQAGKVTGMLLELDDAELLELLQPTDLLAGAQVAAHHL